MTATLDQIEQLRAFAIDFARRMLEENGAFYPFGASMSADDKIVAVTGQAGATDHPSAEDIFERVAEGLVREVVEGKAKAVVLAAQVTIPADADAPATEAIRVHTETRGSARFLFLPFEAQGDEIKMFEAIDVVVEASFFKGA